MKKIPCLLLVGAMLLVYVSVFGVGLVNRMADAPPEPIDGQMLTIDQMQRVDGAAAEAVSLPAYLDVQDEIRLRATLNYAFAGHTAPALIVQANHSFMTVVLDGREIYRVEPADHSLGNYFLRVQLPQQAENAQLELRITVPEGGFSRVQLPEITVAAAAVYQRNLLLGDIDQLLLNILILFCGLLVIGLSIASHSQVDLHRMLLRGVLALNCALYFMCETPSVVYLAQSARMVYMIDMLSFAMLGLPLLLLLGWELKAWRHRLIQAVAGLGAANVLVQAGLGLTGVVELRRMLPMTHAVQIISILAILCCLGYGLWRRERSKNMLAYGLICAGGAMDLVLFLTEANRDNVFFVKIALLVYLFQQLYGFVRMLMDQSAEKAREGYYRDLALQDPLTRCFSRAAFEIDRRAWNGQSVRTVFCLDLNNLKQTNDLHGHGVGDQLIRALGEVLGKVFFSVGKCYRVGGDEFWVFCDDLQPGQAAQMVLKAQQAALEYNAKLQLPARLRYAIGVCDTAESGGDLGRAIALADQRMYENKRLEKTVKF